MVNLLLGVVIHQARDPKTGKPLLVLNNVSKNERKASFQFNDKPVGSFMDAITGRRVPSRLVLQPCEVRMLIHVET